MFKVNTLSRCYGVMKIFYYIINRLYNECAETIKMSEATCVSSDMYQRSLKSLSPCRQIVNQKHQYALVVLCRTLMWSFAKLVKAAGSDEVNTDTLDRMVSDLNALKEDLILHAKDIIQHASVLSARHQVGIGRVNRTAARFI